MTRPIDDLSDRYVEGYARLHPVAATVDGIAGYDDQLTDYSPDGADERAAHDRATLRTLDTLELDGDADRVAAGVMRERLEVAGELHERGEHLRSIA
ncbi:MAG: DUF885 family protein, partial [Acidimicrobiia bacterium]|nr:DUF885 family protein [Acidimicrobiia bacterium]